MTHRTDPVRLSRADINAVIVRLGRGADPGWYHDAECAGMDADLWHPPKGGDDRTPKAICARCPVRLDCLTVAVKERERFGIWGGYSDRGRKAIIREIMRRRPELLPTELDRTKAARPLRVVTPGAFPDLATGRTRRHIPLEPDDWGWTNFG